MKIENTFIAKISVGFREGYSQVFHTLDEVYAICQEYCNNIGLCVTVTPTRFIYSQRPTTPDGWEDGCFIELIQYPVYPCQEWSIKEYSFELAKLFLKAFKQKKVSVICSDQTYTIQETDL